MYIKAERSLFELLVASLASLLLASVSISASAQETDADDDEVDVAIEQIVVTGTRTGRALTRFRELYRSSVRQRFRIM